MLNDHNMIITILGGLFSSFVILVAVMVSAWAVISAVSWPDAAWLASGSQVGKAGWIVILLLSWLFCGVGGPLAALFYLLAVRPKLVRTSLPPS